MHLKRYRSKSVREALTLARAELGPNALVLSTCLVGEHGWRGWLGARVVEIIAAATRDMSESRPTEAPARQSAPATVPDRAPDAHTAAVIARLCAAGLDRAFASEAAGTIPRARRREASVAQLRRAVADTLGALAAGSDALAGAEVFVGPPGVGKTTTIAKLAAQERAVRGARIGLVAADAFRVGAVEQLRTYADIIGVPFTVARTPSDLDATLGKLQRGPVLVDTAGRTARDPEWAPLLEMLHGRPDVRTQLVLSAAMPVRDAGRVLDAFAAAQPSRVVLTRVDEAEAIGPIVRLLRERRVPVSFLGTGQRVPEDLARATPEILAAHVLGESPASLGAPA